ncbi:LuxR C-terminal-related transcriptional regulator [Pararhizobium sp.]|uniref:LuxR C-terminal-related transcriptional regulator n=1 Tax=Pararhizobium sp. TaxID=1977563 RepID=UPI002726514A|nr:LuxR C-terminal-related transcriptional regulator [Pararhizobium sp.]MDO9415080.1 LuxR C-terminal-related transcriptional regulator [Pararhizobium sp.]
MAAGDVEASAYAGTASPPSADWQVLDAFTQRFGFTHFFIARMPQSESALFSDVLGLTNWPAGLVAAYEAASLFSSSALVRALSQTRLPVFNEGCLLAEAWMRGADDGPSGDVAELFEAAGLRATLGIQLSNRDGEGFVLVLSGRRDALSAIEAVEFTYESLRIFDTMENNATVTDMLKDQLSVREIECLRLAADGKSSEDIAICLGVSTLAVSSYFKSASEKLSAVNRLQAVARALRLKII